MGAGLSAILGRVKNSHAHQQGSLLHPLAAVDFQAIPGSNSLLRWKPACEARLSKTNRKRQASYIVAAASEEMEPPAAPLPLPSKAPKKKTFQQVFSAGVLSEQPTNPAAPAQPASQPIRPPKPEPLATATAATDSAKENAPPPQQLQAARGVGLAQLFRRQR